MDDLDFAGSIVGKLPTPQTKPDTSQRICHKCGFEYLLRNDNFLLNRPISNVNGGE
jgi:hypothetical protein